MTKANVKNHVPRTRRKEIQTDGLNPRQLVFAEFILAEKPGREAYKLAFGISNNDSADAASSRLLADVKVGNYIAKRRKEIVAILQEKTNIDRERFMQELETIGFSKITDYLSFGESGVVMKDSDEIDEQKIGAIKEVESITTSMVGDEGKPEVLRTQTKFKIYDKVSALIEYGKVRGFINPNEKPQNNIQVNINVIGNGTRNL